MKIVVLDGYTLNPGDLSWDGLRPFGECVVFDRTPPDQVVERAAGAEIVLTNKTVIARAAITRLAMLRYVGVLATGYDVVDVTAARERGVIVTNVPDYGTRSVAQMTFALLLELTNHVAYHAETVRHGRWSRSADFCYWDPSLIGLDGLNMGILGLGRIGSTVAQVAGAFGMSVLACTQDLPGSPPADVRLVGLDTLFAESDVVSLHCPLTADTRGIVSSERLALMKRSAFLINTARGPLVDEHALADALGAGRIAGAGLDVLSVEPPTRDNPLLHARNCLITPHIAWATRAARARLMDVAVANVAAFLEGRPENVVSWVES